MTWKPWPPTRNVWRSNASERCRLTPVCSRRRSRYRPAGAAESWYVGRTGMTMRTFARSTALQLLALGIGLSAAGCCRFYPGAATAATQRTSYRAGDTVSIALLNRTNEARRAPSPGERSALERYSGGRWLPVLVRDPEQEPFLLPDEDIQATLPVERSVGPCSAVESHFALPRSLAPGRYRIRIPGSWTSNAFRVGAPSQ
jgi:hypothetical protein